MDIHGGEIYDKNIWLDFSVNTNPLGMPEEAAKQLAKSISVCERYPDDACFFLREKLAAHYRAQGYSDITPGQILCTAGASEGILAVVRALDIKKRRDNSPDRSRLRALLPVPCFSEYERSLISVEADIYFWQMDEQTGFCLTEQILTDLTDDIDLLILCNPNNPVGNLADRELLQRILSECREKGICVAVDQCFLEFAEEYRRYDLTGCLTEFSNLVIINAFTKTYAFAGLRLGYLMCSDVGFLRECSDQMPCWSVSIPAQTAGEAALDSTEYMEQSRRLIREERIYLKTELEREGFLVLPGTADFLCFRWENKMPGSRNLYRMLLERGVLIRDCSNFRGMPEGYYRIAVRTRKDNNKLLELIGECLTETEELMTEG